MSNIENIIVGINDEGKPLYAKVNSNKFIVIRPEIGGSFNVGPFMQKLNEVALELPKEL